MHIDIIFLHHISVSKYFILDNGGANNLITLSARKDNEEKEKGIEIRNQNTGVIYYLYQIKSLKITHILKNVH